MLIGDKDVVMLIYAKDHSGVHYDRASPLIRSWRFYKVKSRPECAKVSVSICS